MLPPLENLQTEDIARMDRAELIDRLLALNPYATFRFTPAWLKKQWTRRLRALLLAARRPCPSDENSAAFPARIDIQPANS